jgi:hypothetical protein
MRVPVTLVSTTKNRGITGRLREVRDRLGDSRSIDVRLRDNNDPECRLRDLITAEGVALIDGHWTEDGSVDGVDLGARVGGEGIKASILVVGCCWGGTSSFTSALRQGLDRPTAFLGYFGETPISHARLVFAPVLEAVAAHSLDTSPTQLEHLLRACLHRLREQHPRMTSLDGWQAEVLLPLANGSWSAQAAVRGDFA